MAEGQQVSSLPLPPLQYVNLYTDENVKRGRAPKPPPCVKDKYTMFGVEFNAEDPIIRPLESQGLRRLYPNNYDHKRELKKLNHSILINFLDILDILIKAPDSPKRGEKIGDLTLLFIHMHHLINEFRPHQARETLRVLLEQQRRQRLETAERFQKHLEKVQELLQSCLASLPDDVTLDSKLLIKMEPSSSSSAAERSGETPTGPGAIVRFDSTASSGGDVPMSNGFGGDGGVGNRAVTGAMAAPPAAIKQEIKQEQEEVDWSEINTLDQMMCDIVDALN